MTAHERSGWRDESLSRRHRRWGFNCPAVDLDFLLVEYHLGCPVAVVDYKHHKSREVNFEHPTYSALGELYDSRAVQLPLLIARYWPESWAFSVLGLNQAAKSWLPTGRWVGMSERQFIGGLYKMRRLKVDERVLYNLNDIAPPGLNRRGLATPEENNPERNPQ